MQSILYGLLLQVKSATTLFDANLRLRAAEKRVAVACRERILPGRASFPSAAVWTVLNHRETKPESLRRLD